MQLLNTADVFLTRGVLSLRNMIEWRIENHVKHLRWSFLVNVVNDFRPLVNFAKNRILFGRFLNMPLFYVGIRPLVRRNIVLEKGEKLCQVKKIIFSLVY